MSSQSSNPAEHCCHVRAEDGCASEGVCKSVCGDGVVGMLNLSIGSVPMEVKD